MATKKIAQAPIERVDRQPVVFQNQDSKLWLAGIVYRPRQRRANEKLPLVIIGGPMASVKELTQSLYAQLLADRGYATMVFDHSFVGSSEGHPRAYEDPEVKGSDWRSAITFAQTLPDIDADRIAGIGICGSGVYLPCGVKDDARMKAVVSIVPFTIMDIVVTATDEQLLQMKADYENGAEPDRLHMIEEGSEGALYYFDPNRGAAVQMVEMPTWSQLAWHQFHPTEIIRDFRKPYLVITGEQAFTRPGAELMYQNAASEVKELHVIPGALHFEMYDHEEYVMQNLALIEKFLKDLNSAVLWFNNLYKYLSNKKLPRILSCWKFHLP